MFDVQMNGPQMVSDLRGLPLHDGPQVGRTQPLQVHFVAAPSAPRPVPHPPPDQSHVAHEVSERVEELCLHHIVAFGDGNRVNQEVQSVG